MREELEAGSQSDLHSRVIILFVFLLTPCTFLHPVIQANKETGAWWLSVIPITKTQ